MMRVEKGLDTEEMEEYDFGAETGGECLGWG